MLSENGRKLLTWIGVFTVLMTVILVLRFKTARIKQRSYRLDDYFIVLSYIGLLGLEACSIWMIANGMGAHTQELSPEQLIVQYKGLLATGATWLFATSFCKLSILTLYVHIFATKPFKIATWIIMGCVLIYGVAFMIYFFTNCRPLAYTWDHTILGGHCSKIANEEISSVSVNMGIDTAIVILPMPVVWRLQMPTSKKFGVSFLFSLGLLVVAVQAWRIKLSIASVSQLDYVYGLGNIGLVTHLEVWIGMIVACLPTITHLFSSQLQNLASKFSRFSSGRGFGKQRGLQEATHTIGSSEGPGFRKKDFSRLDEENLIHMSDLEGSKKTEAIGTTTTSSFAQEDRWIGEPDAIGVRQDITVLGHPRN